MQHSFLFEVAEKLYKQYGDDISSLTLVFPSQRARLFFSDTLSKLIEKPIWQPSYISMDDIMSQGATIEVGEKILLITELFSIYQKHHPQETFDKFYFWGEMLLGDFDLIDKYIIDAEMLFRNIYDLKELEADLSYLTPEMRQIINAFWSNFSDKEKLSDEKQKFLTIWTSLAPIYKAFQLRMEQMKLAYTGKIYRMAVEKIERGESTIDTSRHYVFIGFNALSECEKRVLKYLKNNCECDFFWDYDDYYTKHSEQEAGRFLRENLRLYPETLEVSHNNFLEIKKEVKAISTVSNAVQCKYVNTLLREISPDLKFDKKTAIVLTDESLLMPLLHSLPEEVQDNINVTMGYPLRQTIAYSFLERLIELQNNKRNSNGNTTFYHIDAVGILTHPYIVDSIGEIAQAKHKEILDSRMMRVNKSLFEGIELLETIFSPTDGYKELTQYLLKVLNTLSEQASECEERSLKLAYMSILAKNIQELDNCLNKCNIEITTSIYNSLLRRHLQTIRIPFSGEPLQGLQVMGILETRNIDFENVIILSMNDDNFPGNTMGASSFIPYNLRAAYGIPTPEHHEGVYAYYFYRLIQRAKRVDMLYCSHADDKTTGEQSRYIYQLDYESPYQPERVKVGVDVAIVEPEETVVEKSGEVLEKLQRYFDDEKKYLSPSAFSHYIACPMRFYFSAIAKLKDPEELSEEVDNRIFGLILHDAMDTLYKPFIAENKPGKRLSLISDKKISDAVTEALNKNFLNDPNASLKEYTGQLKLIHRITVKYIRNIISYDAAHDDFKFELLEEDVYSPFDLGDGRVVHIGGRADRVDTLDKSNAMRVVDYKSGSQKSTMFNTIEDIFYGEKRAEMQYILQTMMYSMVLNKKFNRDVQPALYFVRDINKEDYAPQIIHAETEQVTDAKGKTTTRNIGKHDVFYEKYAEEFEQQLRAKLNELFDSKQPFARCPKSESDKVCKYCNFKPICNR